MSKATQILISYAESIRGEVLFDLKFNLNPLTFFRAKFEKDREDEIKLCKSIYKYKS